MNAQTEVALGNARGVHELTTGASRAAAQLALPLDTTAETRDSMFATAAGATVDAYLVPLSLAQSDRLLDIVATGVREAAHASALTATDLIELATDDTRSESDRATAALLLGFKGLGDSSVGDFLVNTASGPEENNVRAAAVHALGFRGDGVALAQVIRHGARNTRGAAQPSLLPAGDLRTTQIALGQLPAVLPLEAIAAVGELLAPERRTRGISDAAMQAAARSNVDELWRQVIEQSKAGRSDAVAALAELTAPAAARELATFLDRAPTTRLERKRARLAAAGLLKMGEQHAVQALHASMAASDSRRRATLEALPQTVAAPSLWPAMGRLAAELESDDPGSWALLRGLRKSVQANPASDAEIRRELCAAFDTIPTHSELHTLATEIRDALGGDFDTSGTR